MTELISLEEHNKKHGVFFNFTPLVRNGIACPNCGEGLVDSNPNMMLLSNPPQFHIHCPSCNYHGTRF
jgi:hypothetical protein